MTSRNESQIEQTEDDIEETRDRVRRHIDALQSDLTPAGIMNQLVPEGHSIGETIHEVMQAARRNPLGTALLAGGTILLGREILESRNEYHLARRRAQAEDAAARVGEGLGELRQSAERTAQRAKSAGQQAADAAREGYETAASAVSTAAQRSSEYADEAYRSARRKLAKTGDEVAAAGHKGRRWIEQNPLATGLVCAAAGALVASYFAAKPLREEEDAYEPRRDTGDRAGGKPAQRPRPTQQAAAPTLAQTDTGPKARKTRKPAETSSKPTSPVPGPAATSVKTPTAAGGVDRPATVTSTADKPATSSADPLAPASGQR